MSSDPRPAKRPFLSSAECSICFEAYDLNTRFPVMGNCGHTICAACRTCLPSKCPVCQKANAFKNEIKNFSLIQMIEEKYSEAKRQKTDPSCSPCQTHTDDEDSHVCLACVQKKSYTHFHELMKEVDSLSFKMCSRCAEAMQKHDGHETHKLCDAKKCLLSMELKLNVEFIAKCALQRLDKFQTASGILNETYREFYEACMTDGQIGAESDFTVLDTLEGDVLRFHRTMMSNTTNIWKLTNECLEATQAVTQEKKKRQGRKFTTAEDITFRALLAPTRNDIAADAEVKETFTTNDWKKMTLDGKKAKALEMLQGRGRCVRNEEGNEGGSE